MLRYQILFSQALRALDQAGLHYMHHFEYALQLLDFEAVIVDMHLLVPSVVAASKALKASGLVQVSRASQVVWEANEEHAVFSDEPQEEDEQLMPMERRLHSRVVLLALSNYPHFGWHTDSHCPSLTDLYASFVYRYLTTDAEHLRIHFRIMIAYAHEQMERERLSSAEQVPPIARQFWLDIYPSPCSMAMVDIILFERDILRRIEAGTWTFHPHGTPSVKDIQTKIPLPPRRVR